MLRGILGLEFYLHLRRCMVTAPRRILNDQKRCAANEVEQVHVLRSGQERHRGGQWSCSLRDLPLLCIGIMILAMTSTTSLRGLAAIADQPQHSNEQEQ